MSRQDHGLELLPPFDAAGEFQQGRNGVPSGSRNCLALDVADHREQLGAAVVGLADSEYAWPPLRMIHGTAAKVSVLLMVVGRPYKTKAGRGTAA